MAKKSNLLPCPFCGSEATITNKHYRGMLMRMSGNFGYYGTPEDSKTIYWVGCHSNKTCIHPKAFGEKEEAIKVWNKRILNDTN